MKSAILLPAFLVLAISLVAKNNPEELAVGSKTNNGNLLLYILSAPKTDNPRIMELDKDYGFIIVNLGNEKNPRPLFRLASRKENVIQDFNTFDDFKSALGKLPKGITLYHYDKCLVPLSFGIQVDWDELKKTCEHFEIKLSDTPSRTCVCPD